MIVNDNDNDDDDDNDNDNSDSDDDGHTERCLAFSLRRSIRRMLVSKGRSSSGMRVRTSSSPTRRRRASRILRIYL